MRQCLEEEKPCNHRYVHAPATTNFQSLDKSCNTNTPGLLAGDRIVVVVQKQRNFGPENSTNSGIANKVRRGDIRHAVVVRARKEIQRPDGSLVKFDDNACVLVNKSGDPIGTRLNGEQAVYTMFRRVFQANDRPTGIVGAELRGKQWSKILSLAPMHL